MKVNIATSLSLHLINPNEWRLKWERIQNCLIYVAL